MMEAGRLDKRSDLKTSLWAFIIHLYSSNTGHFID